MDKHTKELLLAKVTTLESSINDPVIQTLCGLLTDIIKANDGETIGFTKAKE